MKINRRSNFEVIFFCIQFGRKRQLGMRCMKKKVRSNRTSFGNVSKSIDSHGLGRTCQCLSLNVFFFFFHRHVFLFCSVDLNWEWMFAVVDIAWARASSTIGCWGYYDSSYRCTLSRNVSFTSHVKTIFQTQKRVACFPSLLSRTFVCRNVCVCVLWVSERVYIYSSQRLNLTLYRIFFFLLSRSESHLSAIFDGNGKL